jgi:hypothetical protein
MRKVKVLVKFVNDVTKCVCVITDVMKHLLIA